ncbi:acetyl-CoA carboxylase carboxyltransferase subunit alpha [Candidatus Finniella inopinata]|uniref:Acetyl-coenzyme A carboxylase carboxyl transferase subunit alpha n=1 Tax=Candidatus Finniella inopinata TaxID=1696036 RepID=A0A4Q7DI23_9PROT|nr:acetyl-CoA carboxylase carboxyltransferase subunit alpha [Candidatus Finniella inopinata]RZI46611.1 acetyl-CoA carboxylase carboxyltransferase subunit alpha [Candidatus Finniella inopinata]
MTKFLDFERPIAELENKIEELRNLASTDELNIAKEVSSLQVSANAMLRKTYKNLTPWQKVQVARHPDRPKFFDYLNTLIQDFIPLAGDRLFGEDNAIIGGLGYFMGKVTLVIGQQKGNDTESRVKHNFGMAKPEGYRKAIRLMELADRFGIPILTFVDTAGAYPGIDAEERGQAEAIARCIEACLKVKVPLVSVVIGEGGSGGAIAIAAANAVLMLEHSVYSVISPEGCASILWRSASKASEAAEAQKLTAQDLLQFGVIDKIIPEPVGGAHRLVDVAIQSVKEAIHQAFQNLSHLDSHKILSHRREKFLSMGSNLA